MNILLDHIQMAIPAGGEDKARAFWADLIGLEELEKPDELKSLGGCWFRIGAQELHLGIEEPFSPTKKAHPGFLVWDADALAEKLGDVIWDHAISDRKRFFTKDPFGNRLEFIQKIAKTR